jgi:hypothetical protein
VGRLRPLALKFWQILPEPPHLLLTPRLSKEKRHNLDLGTFLHSDVEFAGIPSLTLPSGKFKEDSANAQRTKVYRGVPPDGMPKRAAPASLSQQLHGVRLCEKLQAIASRRGASISKRYSLRSCYQSLTAHESSELVLV